MNDKKAPPSAAQDKYVLRMPEGMRDRIKVAAAENSRSMNAEIVHRLEDSFGAPGREEFKEYQSKVDTWIESGRVMAQYNLLKELQDIEADVPEGVWERFLERAGDTHSRMVERGHAPAPPEDDNIA